MAKQNQTGTTKTTERRPKRPAKYEAGVAPASEFVIARPGEYGYERPRADADADARLTASIRRHRETTGRGVQSPVTCERLPDGRLVVLNGRRRVTCAVLDEPSQPVPYVVRPAGLTGPEAALFAVELNATSEAPNAMDLALVCASALASGVDRAAVVDVVGLDSRLTRLLTLVRKGSVLLHEAVRYGNVPEAGALVIVEGSGWTEEAPGAAHVVQDAALALLEEEARATGDGQVSNRLTGSTRARDVEVVSMAEMRWTASRGACEVVIARAAEAHQRKPRRVANKAPAAPPAPPAPPTETTNTTTETTSRPPLSLVPTPPTETTEAPAPTETTTSEAPTETPPSEPPAPTEPPRRAGKAPVAPKPERPSLDAILDERLPAILAAPAPKSDKVRGALAILSAIQRYRATGRRPEGVLHEVYGVLFDALFPTDV